MGYCPLTPRDLTDPYRVLAVVIGVLAAAVVLLPVARRQCRWIIDVQGGEPNHSFETGLRRSGRSTCGTHPRVRYGRTDNEDGTEGF
jgi:hypothetical protein